MTREVVNNFKKDMPFFLISFKTLVYSVRNLCEQIRMFCVKILRLQ